MTIREINEERAALVFSLQRVIEPLLREFEAKTEVTPDVRIDRLDTSTFSGRAPCSLFRVSVSLSI
jgi:hypothetical protein